MGGNNNNGNSPLPLWIIIVLAIVAIVLSALCTLTVLYGQDILKFILLSEPS